MSDPPSGELPQQVTQLLDSLAAGEMQVSEKLLPLVYGDLRLLAASRMSPLAPGQTLHGEFGARTIPPRLGLRLP
jgi:hypothetical protein